MLVLLNMLSYSFDQLVGLLSLIVIDWWKEHNLTIDYAPDVSLVWHDLWAHAAHGFGVDVLGETQAQVIQIMKGPGSDPTISDLSRYWTNLHGIEPPHEDVLKEVLKDILPLGRALSKEKFFLYKVTESITPWIRSNIFTDPF